MEIGKRINTLLDLGAAHSLYDKNGAWYHQFKGFPGILFDPFGYVRFNTKEEYLNHPNLDISPNSDHVHVKFESIQSIPTYTLFTAAELNLLASLDLNQEIPTTESSLRIKRTYEQILRNQELVKKVKKLYKNTCQICGIRLEIRPGKYYSEVHHIKPLGRPHNGHDAINNMLCVCPNHHASLDFCAIALDINELVKVRHKISSDSVTYHNTLWKKMQNNTKAI